MFYNRKYVRNANEFLDLGSPTPSNPPLHKGEKLPPPNPPLLRNIYRKSGEEEAEGGD